MLNGEIRVHSTRELEPGRQLQIGVLGLSSRRAVSFLCDARSRQGGLLYAATDGRKRIIVSADSGATWTSFAELGGDQGKLACLFAARDGVIVKTREPEETLVFDPAGRLLSRDRLGPFLWHGSQSCDQGPTGTVMFAEYQTAHDDEGPLLKVWRTARVGEAWVPVLEMRAGRQPPAGDIRHFHTCVADPLRPGHWLVSSGDKGGHNRIWTSADDGLSWQELEVSLPDAAGHGIQSVERIARFTSLFFEDGVAMWATDDDLGTGRVATVAMSLDQPAPRFRIVDQLGANYARSLVRCGDRFLCITEAKSSPAEFDIHWLRTDGTRVSSFSVANGLGVPSSVTASINSPAFFGGVAFCHNSGSVTVEGQKGLLRLEVIQPAGATGARS